MVLNTLTRWLTDCSCNVVSNPTYTNDDWGGYTKEQYPSVLPNRCGIMFKFEALDSNTGFFGGCRFGSDQGEGYAVAVMMLATKSSDFADRIVFQYDFSGPNDDDTSDYNGPGTHVAGTIVSSMTFSWCK